MTQYHNLDDSGDPGLSNSPSSSKFFALAMVQLAGTESLRELAQARHLLHLASDFEFKYHTSTPAQRKEFFQAIEPLQFRVRAIVVEKAVLGEPYARMNGLELTIHFITHLALRASELDLANDILIVDGATPAFCRGLRIQISRACRERERVRPFNKIVGGRSRYEDGLQLADMIAGATRHYVMGTQSEPYRTFARKVVDLWQVTERGK